MGNIFTRTNNYVKGVKRNTFDKSHQNNLTLKFGYLYPVFCQEVLPKDGWRINPTFGLNFLPMVFPVQTRMKAYMHFFYVRSRSLLKGFRDWYGMLDNGTVTMPYLETSQQDYNDVLGVGSLGDYLGIPTTQVGKYGESAALTSLNSVSALNVPGVSVGLLQNFINSLVATSNVSLVSEYSSTTPYSVATFDLGSVPNLPTTGELVITMTWTEPSSVGAPVRADDYDNIKSYLDQFCAFIVNSSSSHFQYSSCLFPQGVNSHGIDTRLNNQEGYITSSAFYKDNNTTYRFVWKVNMEKVLEFFESPSVIPSTFRLYALLPVSYPPDFNLNTDIAFSSNEVQVVNNGFTARVEGLDASQVVPITYSNSPWHVAGSSENERYKTRLNAMPFRAYEAIYNAFYRDEKNMPFTVNGNPVYNQWIPSDAGGADKYAYKLHKRNWEKDFLTSAVQSPQQGVAPLVGVTSSGTFTFQNEDGTTYSAKATFGEDGSTITGFSYMDSDLPNATKRSLIDMVSSGISINDFRNVNSLQLWLEANIRRGYKYVDVIKSHFDVDVAYKELDMPIFIGGTSQDVYVNKIVQTAPNYDNNEGVGDYTGLASCMGTPKNTISYYCDEPGYIIGIMSVVPVPNYSQLLPKMFLKHDLLDYYFPEFGHIGMQPITYREVCPVQAFQQSVADQSSSMDNVFGYQRAWYDYLAEVDSVHGLMRTSLRNFIMNRTFNTAPQLGEDFLLVDPNQLNDVFVDTTDSDKIIGQIYFDCSVKRAIPEFGIPRLE